MANPLLELESTAIAMGLNRERKREGDGVVKKKNPSAKFDIGKFCGPPMIMINVTTIQFIYKT